LRLPVSGFFVITIGQVMYRPAVLRPALQYRKFQQRKSVALADHFFARSRAHRPRKQRSQLRQLRQHLDFLEQSLRRLKIDKRSNPLRDIFHALDFQRHIHSPFAPKQIDRKRNARSLGVLEQQRRPSSASKRAPPPR
jgi:hypothetical protein